MVTNELEITDDETLSYHPPMPRPNLLPGVTGTTTPPAVVIDSRKAVRRARRRAILRDLLDLSLLGGVDYLFLHWPGTHVPLLDRHDSLMLLVGANVAVIGYVWISRAMPRWSARRIAATWCLAERARFFASERHQQLSKQHQ
jgi:hypothetical protein